MRTEGSSRNRISAASTASHISSDTALRFSGWLKMIFGNLARLFGQDLVGHGYASLRGSQMAPEAFIAAISASE